MASTEDDDGRMLLVSSVSLPDTTVGYRNRSANACSLWTCMRCSIRSARWRRHHLRVRCPPNQPKRSGGSLEGTSLQALVPSQLSGDQSVERDREAWRDAHPKAPQCRVRPRSVDWRGADRETGWSTKPRNDRWRAISSLRKNRAQEVSADRRADRLRHRTLPKHLPYAGWT
jgi:hypothetical protein